MFNLGCLILCFSTGVLVKFHDTRNAESIQERTNITLEELEKFIKDMNIFIDR